MWSRKARLTYIGLAVLLVILLVTFLPIKGITIDSEGRICISLCVAEAAGWVSPTGHNDPDTQWVNEANAYDEDTGTHAYATNQNHYLELTLSSPISCDKIRGYYNTIFGTLNLDIDVYYSGAWNNIHSGTVAKNQWVETEIGSTQTVSQARVRHTSGTGFYFKEFDFNEVAGCSEDITNSPSSWSVNGGSPVAVSSNYSTGLTHFTVTNNSGGAVDIDIRATDMTGGNTWTLSDTATPGSMIYGLKAGLSGGDYTIIVKKNSPYNDLVTGLADSGTQDWGLKLWTPTVYTDGATKTGTVTITATCA